VELVTLRLRATVKSTTSHVGTGAFARPGRAKPGRLSSLKAPVLFDGKKLATSICTRETMAAGKINRGPAIVTEYSATTVIPPGKRFHIDSAGNLVISIQKPKHSQEVMF
jgi:N-methylhydantoinase A